MGPGSESVSPALSLSKGHADVLARYVGTFVDELVACGLEDVCLCPGSRSAPLALMFARHPRVKVWTHLDERSCAYFALGMAKARADKPVAILSTSGTAAVNFAPAVVEAFHACVPLLVLTADRPPELREVGANQTIDQVRLYGSAAKWFVDLPLPEASEEALRYVRMVASRAVEAARQAPRGPVHLNLPFREPLIPGRYEPQVFDTDPAARLTSTASGSTLRDVGSTRDELARRQRGVIVCGPGAEVDPRAVTALADRLGWPLLADPLSDVRCGLHHGPNIIGAYDSFLRVPALAEALAPDLILRFGDPPTSKPLATYLQRHRDVRQLLVAPPGRWPDPDLTADEILHCEPTDLCEDVAVGLEARPAGGWLTLWREAESRTLKVMRRELDSDEGASEPSSILDLSETLPAGCTVFAGNSMPVRDLDTFFPAGRAAVRFLANRGASGIDGVLSTALGAAAVSDGRVVCVVGDLSFYHDMNGLLAARRFGVKATIVLVNNDGGGIFSFLPQHEDPNHFEELFGTPHGLEFRPVAELYGLGFQRVTTRADYRAALLASFEAPGVSVIEVKTDREENLRLHQRIWAQVTAAVSPLPPQGEG